MRMKSMMCLGVLVCVVGLARAWAAEPVPFKATADLPPLLVMRDGTTVTSVEDWPARRDEVRRLMLKYFVGHFPQATPAIVGAELVSTDRPADGSTRRKIRLTLDTPNRKSFEIHVWTPAGDGPFPLLMTQPRGYQIPWAELALKRGYLVCLYPGVDSHHREADYPKYDSIWQTFHAEYPDATWTEISTKAWLASRALDYLLNPNAGYSIARDQIGIIGFSRYGKQSLIATAFDERITAVVARSPGSPGSSPYRFTSRNTFAETPVDFPGAWFLASLKPFAGREHELPIDAHGWYALIAPRHCLIHTAHNDGSEPTFAVERAYMEGRKVYELLGYPERLRIDYREGQHGPITDEHRERNLDWLDLAFGRGEVTKDVFPEQLIHDFDWKRWKAQQRPAEIRNRFPDPQTSSEPQEIRQRIEWMLGRKPGRLEWDGERTFLTPAESQMMTHDRWAVPGVARVPVSFGENVRGNLYFSTTHKGPRPVVIWLHPYSYHSGYNEGYGVQGTTVYHRLAQQGYVVLAYDQCGFGLRLLEGRDFYQHYPAWSRLGRMVHDVRRAVDFVTEGDGAIGALPAGTSLPQMDKGKVICLGYSVGGMVALYAGALDERIQAVASFSGFTPMRKDTAEKSTGGNQRLWKWHALLPKLGLFTGRENQIPYDYQDVLTLLAPRRCLVVAPMRDRHHDVRAIEDAVESAGIAWTPKSTTTGLMFQMPDRVDGFRAPQHAVFLEWAAAHSAGEGDVAGDEPAGSDRPDTGGN